MSELPDKVADALEKWRFAETNRKREGARLLLSYKAECAGQEKTMTELKAMVQNDTGYYRACLEEITAESNYTRLLEKLLLAKKKMSYRAAF